MKKGMQKFAYDRRGISVMQDAVLFCIMVSISAAILMPSFASNSIERVYIEKENEERVDEVLHQLMTCRADEFEYMAAWHILNDLGVSNSSGLLKPLIKDLFGREVMHHTYADLCTECMACQFYFGGKQLNALTEDFTKMIKYELGKFIEGQLGGRYGYNFTAKWRPIAGFDFGGEISTGAPIPPNTDVYTASAYVVMPPSFMTTGMISLLDEIKDYIKNHVQINGSISAFRTGAISEEELRKALADMLTDLLNRVIWKGFGEGKGGIIDISMEYFLQLSGESMKKVFDDATNIAHETAAKAGYGNFTQMISKAVVKKFLDSFPEINVSLPSKELTESAKHSVEERAKEFVNSTVENRIQQLINKIVANIDVANGITEEIVQWLFEQINFCHAKLVLLIWRV